MNAANVICRGLTPCFFAISAAFVLRAVKCGSAISFAFSYVIAPWQSHALMLCNSIVFSFIVGISLCCDFTAGGSILQGFSDNYFREGNNAKRRWA